MFLTSKEQVIYLKIQGINKHTSRNVLSMSVLNHNNQAEDSPAGEGA